MIGIIGYGFVGQALGSVLQDNFQVVDFACERGIDFDTLMSMNPTTIFICVPTPTTVEGCDDSIVMHYIERLVSYNCVVIVKSTIPPSTIDKIMEVRPSTVIWPELLRERHAKQDMRQPSLIVVGAKDKEIFADVQQFIMECTSIEIIPQLIRHVTPKEASLFKYTVNTFLATKVLFMHQMSIFAESIGVEWDNVADVLALEGRVGKSHLRAPGEHGLGFAGTCFPKDTKALAEDAKGELTLLEQTILLNNELRAR
jgi:UDPglucose 6-dehydrogenase